MLEIKEDIYRIRQAVKYIEEDVDLLKVKIDRIVKMKSEDIVAINNDVGFLKKQIVIMESRIKELEMVRG